MQLLTYASAIVTLCLGLFQSCVRCSLCYWLLTHYACCCCNWQHSDECAIVLLALCVFSVTSTTNLACFPDLLEGLWAGMATAHQSGSLTSQ